MMDRSGTGTGCGVLFLLLLASTSLDCAQTPSKHMPVNVGTDCSHIKSQFPRARSGIYSIKPAGVKNPFPVYCEMLPDGGWTVFQRRSGPNVSFKRNWLEYKEGFGTLKEDHWLGLEKLWFITKRRGQKWTLRVDLWDFEGGSAFAEYQNFKLGSEQQGYKLQVGAYRGTAGDAIRGAYKGINQNGYGFSTKDRDKDGCSPCIFGDIVERDCARSQGDGGWWYSRCGSASLHGDWHPARNNVGWASGLHWRTWKGPEPYSAKATRMMIRTQQRTGVQKLKIQQY